MPTGSQILRRAALHRKLERLPKLAKAIIRSAMEQSADDIVRMAKSLCPVDMGDLRDSIGWTWGRAPRGSITLSVMAYSQLASEMTITIYAGDDQAYYARWVEFGTAASIAQAPRPNFNLRRVNIMTKAKRGHPATPAQPFFYPAWRANRREARKNILRAINKAAKMVANT